MQQRIEFIDLAKGICIILVVLLHIVPSANIPELRFIRIPLYFILSGLFFKDYGSFRNFLKKKVNNILIPFLFFYVVSYLIYYIIRLFVPNLYIANASGILDVFTQRNLFNGPLWFLLCLFWTNAYFCIISLIFNKERYRAIIVLIIGVLGAILLERNVFLPMYLDVAMRALPIFYIGFILKHTPILYPNAYDRYNLLFAVILFAITGLMFLYTHPSVPFESTTWEGGILGYIISTAGVLSLFMICKMIKHIPYVSYFGRYSIIVLCTHHLIYRPILLCLSFLLTNYVLVTWCTFGMTLVVTYYLIPLCIKYIPYVTAQKNIFQLKSIY